VPVTPTISHANALFDRSCARTRTWLRPSGIISGGMLGTFVTGLW